MSSQDSKAPMVYRDKCRHFTGIQHRSWDGAGTPPAGIGSDRSEAPMWNREPRSVAERFEGPPEWHPPFCANEAAELTCPACGETSCVRVREQERCDGDTIAADAEELKLFPEAPVEACMVCVDEDGDAGNDAEKAAS